MRHYIRCLLFVLLVYWLSSAVTPGCSIARPPIKGFDISEYVFTGQVVGLLGPFESSKFRRQAWGLLIKIEGEVYLPKSLTNYFEVFPYELWGDCSTAGTSKEKLLKYYPLNSEVKVIAKEAKYLPNISDSGNIRLEIWPGSSSSISRNYYDDGSIMSSINSVYNYSSYENLNLAQDNAPFLEAYFMLPEFEARKDLVRLNNSRAEKARVKILERLSSYPYPFKLVYWEITKRYVSNPGTYKSLLEKWERWNRKMEIIHTGNENK